MIAVVASAPRTISALVAELVEELAEEVPQPLLQSFTLATIAADLCRLAGEPLPLAVAAALDDEPIMLMPRIAARR